MPYDWLFEVERIILTLVPAYTLEMLDNCDIERLLPYYFFDYRKALKAKNSADRIDGTVSDTDDGEFVIRNGKKYRVVNAEQKLNRNNIF